MPAFARALELGVAGVELDIQCSRYGRLVVHHDATLQRMFGKRQPIAWHRLESLREGLQPGDLPELGEVMDLLRGKAGLAIEVKSGRCVLPLARLLNERVESGQSRWTDFSIIGFHRLSLHILRLLLPQAVIGVSFRRLPPNWQRKVRVIKPQFITLNIDRALPAHAEAIAAVGLPLQVWTVNSPAQWEKALALGAEVAMGDDVAWMLSHG